jgi:hypothetical protein
MLHFHSLLIIRVVNALRIISVSPSSNIIIRRVNGLREIPKDSFAIIGIQKFETVGGAKLCDSAPLSEVDLPGSAFNHRIRDFQRSYLSEYDSFSIRARHVFNYPLVG